MRTRRGIGGRLAVVAALVVAGLVTTASPAHAAPGQLVSGSSRGQAAQVNTVPSTQVDLAQSKSRIDSAGIGGGAHVASGTAKPAQVVVSGVTTLLAADSATAAPPPSSDSDGVPGVSLGSLLSAEALSSGSSADVTPRSSNSTRVASATVVKPAIGPALLVTGILTGSADSRRVDDDALSVADAGVVKADVSVVGLAISVEGAVASASARATGVAPNLPGGSAAAVTTCVVAKLKIGPTTLLNIPCNGAELSPLPGVVSIRIGSPTSSATALSATAKVDTLTIRVLSTGAVIILGAVEVQANVANPAAGSPCPFPDRPSARGAALGDVIQVNESLTNLVADVALSKAAIDEAGVAGGPHGATADGIAAQLDQPNIPLLAQIVDSHAVAPPPDSDSTIVAHASIGSLISATTLETNAVATSAPDRSAPSAHADATAQTATIAGLSPVLGLDSTTVASDASSTRNPNNVTSGAHASVEALTGEVAGLPVEVQLLKSQSTAFANGSAGGATTSASTSFALVRVGPVTVSSNPAPGTVINVPSAGAPLVRLTFGVINQSTTPDGTTASASADALVLEVLPVGPGAPLERIVIGRTEASAQVPVAGPAAFLFKDVDIHFDATDSFGDAGANIAPGQKLRYLICYANSGSVPLTNVVIRDVFDPRFILPFNSVFPLPPNVTMSGNTLTTAPFTLAPGQTGSFTVVLEVRAGTPNGVIGNSASLTAGQLGGPVVSNTVSVNIGIVPTQPALSTQLLSQSFNAATRVITLNERLRNAPGASTAFDARIERVGTTNGVVPLDSFPILLGDLAPGGQVPYTLRFYVPNGVGGFSIDILETAAGPDGHRYAFD